MKKSRKRGFTIVELVIVIAVIAILAAILIPTFSNIIKKSNLSADKQAVREMNMALAEEEAHDGYVKPKDVESAMQILANHGYNSKNWKCLTSGYEVYWDSQNNRMVLYNSTTAEIEYPDDYVGTKDINVNATNGRWYTYNGNYEAAFAYDFSFKSSDNSGKVTGYNLANADKTTNKSAATLSAALEGQTGNTIKSAIGVSGDSTLYVNASSTQYSSTYNAANIGASSYAKIDSYYISNSSEIVLDNTGTLKANTYIISVEADKNGLVSTEAKQAAGEYIYSLFVQMNAGAANSDATIILTDGATIDVSKHEWKAADTFTGYFGVADTDGDGKVNPVTIDGARLTSATGHALTYKLSGSKSKYCATGFFGAVYGNATIENVTFKNFTIEGPGKDFVVAQDQNNRNCVGVIGAIIPDPNDRDAAVNVTIKNVKVESTTIRGIGSVGGLVGYIGAEQGYDDLKGTVTIENCSFDGTVESTDSKYATTPTGYSPVGGIIGFTCRCDNENATITVKNTTSTGTVKGYGGVGGVIGNHQTGILNIVNCTIKSTLSIAGASTNLTTYDKDSDYGLYKKDDYKYNGIVVGATGILIGGKSNVNCSLVFDNATLTNSEATANTVLVGNKPAADTSISYPGISHYVAIGDTYLAGNNTDKEYVYFDINASAVSDENKAFVSYLSQNATNSAYSRTASFSLIQYSATEDYINLTDKLIVLSSSATSEVQDNGKSTQRNKYTMVDTNGATDSQGNKYNVTITVSRDANTQASGDNKGKYKYTYSFTFTKVDGIAVSFVSANDFTYNTEAKLNTQLANIGYTEGGADCYKVDVLQTVANQAKHGTTDTYYYVDNINSQIADYSTIKYTVKANYN